MIKKFLNNFKTAWKLPGWRRALLLALISDILGFAFTFTPPVYWVIDAITVILLFVFVGFKWALLPALLVEVIPSLQLFPAWTLVVLALAGSNDKNALQS